MKKGRTTKVEYMKKNNTLIMISNALPEDIQKVVKLQEGSFRYLARYGNV
jgi:hypothetical protein